MKKILLFSFLFFSASHLQAQEQNTPAAQLAHHISNKMADSLNLSNQQRAKIFAINMELYKQKKEARGRSQDRNIVGKDLQKIEGTRDGLYKSILTTEQYVLYLTKKRNLVTSK